MLDKLQITRRTENEDGSLSVSVKTNDSVHGPHCFATTISDIVYGRMPTTKAAKETAIIALVRPNIQKQHAAWLKRIANPNDLKHNTTVLDVPLA